VRKSILPPCDFFRKKKCSSLGRAPLDGAVS
jgi:hypothetical protein